MQPKARRKIDPRTVPEKYPERRQKMKLSETIESLLPDEETAIAEIETMLQGAESDLETTLAELEQEGQQKPRSGQE